MKKRILLLADLHGNFPALEAIDRALDSATFDHIVNCGDSLVYAPFPNETLRWLRQHRVLSILGNTDRKVMEMLHGKLPKKPKREEKRIMYTSTAESLDDINRQQLLALGETARLVLAEGGDDTDDDLILGIYHGSPADPEEFLFADTPDSRFAELAKEVHCRLVVTGHSHSPYHKVVAGVHFINPGSAGRMFDGDPRASCAIVDIVGRDIAVRHLRIDYDIKRVVEELARQQLPEIYGTMFQQGRKLN
jgi:predicted phosphodiesterase